MAAMCALAMFSVLTHFWLFSYCCHFHILLILIFNLDIFKGAEAIAGEEKSDEARYRGHCARVEVGKCWVVTENYHYHCYWRLSCFHYHYNDKSSLGKERQRTQRPGRSRQGPGCCLKREQILMFGRFLSPSLGRRLLVSNSEVGILLLPHLIPPHTPHCAHQRPKNPNSALALLSGKFLRVQKVFARMIRIVITKKPNLPG